MVKMAEINVKEITCKTAIGKCGFPGGGWAVNPYVGCAHDCKYCYARFMRRFTGHEEEWGKFVDIKVNIAEALLKQLRSRKYKAGQIYIGTVTDPYQPLEKKYRITRNILSVLKDRDNPVSILTKSDLVLRDLGLIKQFKEIDVNFTVNTMNEKWKKLVEPSSTSVRRRLKAMKVLSEQGITVIAMMGPYWPFFTDPDELFKRFKQAGVRYVFSESFNATGGNWKGVEAVLQRYYPKILPEIKNILFNPKEFYRFYSEVDKLIEQLSLKYDISAKTYFGIGHTVKFKQ